MSGKLLKIVLVLSLAANMTGILLGLVLFDRALFYRNKIAADEGDFLNEGLRIVQKDVIREARLPHLGVFLGGSLFRYWFLPADSSSLLVNYGGIEEKIQDTYTKLQKIAVDLKPEFVIINGGFCQIHTAVYSGLDIENAINMNIDYMRMIIDEALSHGIKPVLSSLTPVRPVYLLAQSGLFDRPIVEKNIENEAIRTYNTKVRELALTENLPFLDFHTVLADGKGVLNKKYSLMDGEHLNRNGYKILNEYLISQLVVLQADP